MPSKSATEMAANEAGGESSPRSQNSAAAMRRLRDAIGFSQEQMAEKLGISVATLRAIEAARRPVTQRTAQLAEARFGVFAESLLGETGEPMTLLGERVALESLIRVCPDTGMQKVSKNDIEMFVGPLTMLLEVAAHRGRLLPLALRLKGSLGEVASDLDLTANLEGEADRRYRKPVARRFSRKELRERPELADALGIVDDPSAPEDEILIVQSAVKGANSDWLSPVCYLPLYKHHVDADGNQRFTDRSGKPVACENGFNGGRY
jgi:hypothetical protein